MAQTAKITPMLKGQNDKCSVTPLTLCIPWGMSRFRGKAIPLWAKLMIRKVKVLVSQSYPTLFDPLERSPPGSTVPGNLQARIPEWVAIPFSGGSSWPRDWAWVSYIAGRFFTVWVTREEACLGDQTKLGWNYTTATTPTSHYVNLGKVLYLFETSFFFCEMWLITPSSKNVVRIKKDITHEILGMW